MGPTHLVLFLTLPCLAVRVVGCKLTAIRTHDCHSDRAFLFEDTVEIAQATGAWAFPH